MDIIFCSHEYKCLLNCINKSHFQSSIQYNFLHLILSNTKCCRNILVHVQEAWKFDVQFYCVFCVLTFFLNHQMVNLSSLCRVNDWLLKINDVDLTNKDRKQVIKAVQSGEGVINMVVRRRKSLGGRIVTPIQINLAGHKGQPKLQLRNKYGH